MYHSVVVAQSDPHAAQGLVTSLKRYVDSVRVARTVDEIESSIPRYRVDLAVVDLEMFGLDVVKHLSHDYNVRVICTHRVPDEEMWTAALSAGAEDCCQNCDVSSILSALQQRRAA